ncbi:hypothetical protein BOTBODRAFT_27083 [Botryobasidium botryosum FD-172 SS1]|uniref:Alcohol dehydrogenase-like N-terminal domain-containing protein n=1 Tax=Botryobasidium botryosum (strain FD-172 SS1) TaxID=930990 RepID=A0A067NAC1_BOTB1|nr:hypothetical protein BOTBODRAFT_27083 [Botryobasidium botryosum FD-172 SS1]
MAKPTLIQVLFGLPTHTYASPSSTVHSPMPPGFYRPLPDPPRTSSSAPRSRPPSMAATATADADDRRASGGSADYGQQPASASACDKEAAITAALSTHVPPVKSLASPSTPSDHDSDPDASDSDADVYFTPLSSPAHSPHASPKSPAQPAFSTMPLGVRPVSDPAPSILSRPSLRSDSPVSDDDISNFSVISSHSTAITSLPASSDHGHPKSLSPPPGSAHILISSHRSRALDKLEGGAPPPVPPNWAKDVRWLVPPGNNWPNRRNTIASSSAASTSSIASASVRRRRHGRNSSMDISYADDGSESIAQLPPPRNTRPPPSRARSCRPKKRMSGILEVDENDENMITIAGSSAGSPRRQRSQSSRRPLSTHSGTSMMSPVVLPSPLGVSDGTTPTVTGYTSLTLPRAAYQPSKHPSRISSQIDITRSGLAQSSMSTISICRGAANTARSRLLTLPFAMSSSALSSSSAGTTASMSKDKTPFHLRSKMPTPLGFTSRTPPPNKVPSTCVLVHVQAVALDTLDAMIIADRAARSDGFGFVPGRSFVGCVIEYGWEVNNVAKGDWVVGLLEFAKCGALSEFVVVDRRRLYPCMPPHALLSLEQLALLPLLGVPAHRAVRTFMSPTPHGTRALVLQAHDGPGALAVQELAGMGVRVTAQVSPDVVDVGSVKSSVPGASAGTGVVERTRAFGAAEVVVREPLAAIEECRDDQFDLVIDTVGGRSVWQACRRVLHATGQFTTLVGDSTSALPTTNAHFKSNLRSLRRAFLKKDRKAIGYMWVSAATEVDHDGEDVRHSLEVVVRMAGEGVVAPVARGAIAFEEAPEAFGPDSSAFLDGGPIVVKVGR